MWFLHTLALALGRPVGELLRSISSAELAAWQAFYNIEPFGPTRGDLQSAIVAQSIAGGRVQQYMPFERDPMESPNVRRDLARFQARSVANMTKPDTTQKPESG